MKNKKIITIIAVCICMLLPLQYLTAQKTKANTNGTKIKITAGETVLTATMNNSKTTQDFLSLLPMELTLTDYVKKEKISSLPAKLSVEGAPAGAKPSAGDIAYYSPWGNLAIFYKEAPYANSLIIMGSIDDSVKALNVSSDIKVKIELYK